MVVIVCMGNQHRLKQQKYCQGEYKLRANLLFSSIKSMSQPNNDSSDGSLWNFLELDNISSMDFIHPSINLPEDISQPPVSNRGSPNHILPLSSLNDMDLDFIKELEVFEQTSEKPKPFDLPIWYDDRDFEPLQIVRQPYQSSKLRYRSDYLREKGRIGCLQHKVKCKKFKGPAISIPNRVLNSKEESYVRISLVTVKYGPTNHRFIHPYDLEHARNEECIDQTTNSVWIRINPDESIKNFPSLRIVKKKFPDIQKLHKFRVFDRSPMEPSDGVPIEHQFDVDADIFQKYSLEKSHLAFTLAETVLENGQMYTVLYRSTTVYSEEMIENNKKQSDDGSSNEETRSASRCYVDNYAPKRGMNGYNEEMLIFLRRKLDLKRNGKLTIKFQSRIRKSQDDIFVVDFCLKERMISFKIPDFPRGITKPTKVDIVLAQKHRVLDVLKYTYLPRSR